MQIVIELSDLDYKWITLRKGDETLYPLTLTIYEAIKNGKPLEQEPLEVEAAQLQKAYNKGFEDCRQAVLDKIEVEAWAFCDYLIRAERNDEQKPVSHFTDNLRECISDDLQPVNPQEPKTGHWILVFDGVNEYGDGIYHHECSECGCNKSGWGEYNYCPDCGEKMIEPQESEE